MWISKKKKFFLKKFFVENNNFEKILKKIIDENY